MSRFNNNKSNSKLGQHFNETRRLNTIINVKKQNELQKNVPIVVSPIQEVKPLVSEVIVSDPIIVVEPVEEPKQAMIKEDSHWIKPHMLMRSKTYSPKTWI